MIKSIILITLLSILYSCSESKPHYLESMPNFLALKGVSVVDSIMNVYQYKDTLYYYEPETKVLFKIPGGFHYDNKDISWRYGIRLMNENSSIKIYVDSHDGRVEPEKFPDEERFVWLWSYCWDNNDVKIYVDESQYGYTKIGFNNENKPIYEKCFMYHDENDVWKPHLIRIEYADSLAKQASYLIWEHIDAYPPLFNKY